MLLFDLFYEYLLSQEVQEDHIIKIELDQRRYYGFRNPITLCEYVEDLVTGSYSKGLSKDIATEFRGRATQIHVFPLSFEEFYSHVGRDDRKAL